MAAFLHIPLTGWIGLEICVSVRAVSVSLTIALPGPKRKIQKKHVLTRPLTRTHSAL